MIIYVSKRSYTDEQFIEAVSASHSWMGVLRCLGLKVGGGTHLNIQKLAKRLELNTDHFTGQGHLKGKTHNWGKAKLWEDILVENSTYQNTDALKKRLWRDNRLEQRCYICNLADWLGQPLALQLDHINGIRDDNRIENLRILCPNCHAQTVTYCGKNKDPRGEISRLDGFKTRCLEERASASLAEGILKSKRNSRVCICGVFIGRDSATCKDCRSTKIVWPSKDELEKLVWEIPTRQLAKQLGVSDVAIAKHCQKYGIIKPPRGYWAKALSRE